MSDLLVALAGLFKKTGQAHHTAFIDTDSVDSEWAIWYADYLHETLTKKLNASFSKSELIYLLITVDREISTAAPGTNWTDYYARFFIERYGE